MELALLLEYSWVFIVLIGLEGILAADNAVVMAVMVKHLPTDQRKKALFYGLIGAFIFRFIALFLISYLVNIWQVQAVGAVYLLYLMFHHLYTKYKGEEKGVEIKKKKQSSFWMTVLKVELADIAFALDSMLAAVALAMTLTPAGWFRIGGLDGGQFLVMFLGGLVGLVMIRFAANWFVKILVKYPLLETTAFFLVGWVGVKLAVLTLAHPRLQILNENFPESTGWQITFWGVMVAIIGIGYFLSVKKQQKVKEH